EGHGGGRLLAGERERGAHLTAVERAVTGAAEPARALPRPIGRAGIVAGHPVAGFVASEPGAPRAIIFAAIETFEAEAFVRHAHRPVGIAFARGDRIPHAGD